MHYIAGTSLSVKPDPSRGFRSRENAFICNITYTLSTITKQDNNLAYTFIGTNGTSAVLLFETARLADSFIAKLRGENIPDYDNKVDNDSI
jgi:hypothetical protein